jgi:hypothetical protein
MTLKWEVWIGHDNQSKQALILLVGKGIGVVVNKKELCKVKKLKNKKKIERKVYFYYVFLYKFS